MPAREVRQWNDLRDCGLQFEGQFSKVRNVSPLLICINRELCAS